MIGVMAKQRKPAVRDSQRSAAILFRMSHEERSRLHEEAVAEGFATVQQLLEFRIFGEYRPVRRRSRTLKPPQEERLDISA